MDFYLNSPQNNIQYYQNVQSISPQGSMNYQNMAVNGAGGSMNYQNMLSGSSGMAQDSVPYPATPQTLSTSSGMNGASGSGPTKKCSRCYKMFYSSDFYQPTCTYHLDNFVKMEDRWKCCGRSGKQAPPCYNAFHIEDESTSNILQSMTVPKPEIIQQNNPIFQGGNYGYIGAEKILYESILKKQGKTLGRWAKRKFRLTHSTLINYYDETEVKVHRVFQLADISITYKKLQAEGEYRICMIINDGSRNHLLYSPIPNQTEAWINALITQKKILLQSKSNQLLQLNTPQYPPFPISSSPPKYSYLSSSISSPSINNLYPQAPQPVPQTPQPVPQVYVYLQTPNQNPPIYSSLPPNHMIPQQQQQQQQTQAINTTPGGEWSTPDGSQQTNNIQWVQHHVSTSDTLAGIAIRYNTSIDIIKRINLIKGNSCITHQTLLIPVSTINPYTPPPPQPMSEEERRRKLVQLFAVSENISKEEARSYLCNNDWDISKAIKELKEDLDWELSHPYKGN